MVRKVKGDKDGVHGQHFLTRLRLFRGGEPSPYFSDTPIITMSGGLAPSKTTVYVSNLPFALTNNDLHKIFEKYGKVVKVTVMRDKITRQSKGVAFVLFLKREEAHACVRALNGKVLFGRTVKCSMAKDNGRASEFIRRKVYKDKSQCYECGEEGHMSYACPKNTLGEREPPPKKEKKRKKSQMAEEEYQEEDESDEGEDPALDSLGAAIRYEQAKIEEEEYRYRVATGSYEEPSTSQASDAKKKKFKKDEYFSDEEDISDHD
ncbi:zinc finger CCHC-type and RNA-binding motif-containing protein 1-like isoform X3 [Branchiostoma floridae]|uniref:Zinc finger CCHC-type and RNA-binding motif-containing protein 1 n=1 Tax=Branchiostoma floridae TaxID=7739 RepID=A0A9J7MRU5_BRAFL|nr:zinc finger CCHC-type and RNA-binding motif-containing protein 1-like isoform X3 [Branchiostoma floridae]